MGCSTKKHSLCEMFSKAREASLRLNAITSQSGLLRPQFCPTFIKKKKKKRTHFMVLAYRISHFNS